MGWRRAVNWRACPADWAGDTCAGNRWKRLARWARQLSKPPARWCIVRRWSSARGGSAELEGAAGKKRRCDRTGSLPKLRRDLNTTESRYVEKKGYLSQLAHGRELAFRETEGHLDAEFGSEAEWLRCLQEEFPSSCRS